MSPLLLSIRRRASIGSVFLGVESPLLGVQLSSSLESVRAFYFLPTLRRRLTSALEGSSVAVFGCGAIGLGVITTSQLVGASRIIAVDTNAGKESWATKFGATDFVNPSTLPKDTKIQDYLVELTDGGLDYTFDCTGNVCIARSPLSCFSLTRTRRFTSCGPLLRLATKDGVFLLSLVLLLQDKRSQPGREHLFVFSSTKLKTHL